MFEDIDWSGMGPTPRQNTTLYPSLLQLYGRPA